MKIAVDACEPVGQDLIRPECVLCTRMGDVFAPHLGKGIVRIAADGSQSVIGDHATVAGLPFVPNGLALMRDGSFLVTNMGEGGGVYRMSPAGDLTPFLVELDGRPLAATNFVLLDERGRIWITVTTRRWPISEAFDPTVADGHIILVDGDEARIVFEGLSFANELRLDPAGRHLYVVETMKRRVSRLPVADTGDLGAPETFAQFGHGTLPDGMAFDAEGHLWVTSILSNRVIRIAPDGSWEIVLEDCDPDYVDAVERKMRAGELQREDMQNAAGRILRNVSSLAFGGPDLKTIYLGSLGGNRLARFTSPVAGMPMAHWGF